MTCNTTDRGRIQPALEDTPCRAFRTRYSDVCWVASSTGPSGHVTTISPR
jgi:hypothetical protein